MANQSEKKHFTSWGVVIITGTIVSGGMLALSVDPARVWSFWGTLIPAITWFSMLHSGLLLLGANLNYPVGSSFNTIIKDPIGNIWNVISSVIIIFVPYILTHAYISVDGTITSEAISVNLGYHANPRIIGVCTAIFIVSVLWIDSLAASHIAPLFLGSGITSLVIVFGSSFFQINHSTLRDSTSTTTGTPYFPRIFMTLPVCLASFGLHGNVPSLIIYYGKHKDKLIESMVLDSLLALIVYLFWLYCMMGDIPRENLKATISSSGNVDSLMKSFFGTKQHRITEFCLLVFSSLTVISSFFDVMLGSFDYLASLFKIDSPHDGCFKTVLLTFLPPVLLYLIFPNSFTYGAGNAGLCVTIWATIIPATLTVEAYKRLPDRILTVWGNDPTPAIVILFGITVILCWFDNVSNMLSKFD